MEHQKIRKIQKNICLAIADEVIKQIEKNGKFEWGAEWEARYVGRTIGEYLQSLEPHQWERSLDIAAQKRKLDLSLLHDENRETRIRKNILSNLSRARRMGARADLTFEQWVETLKYFGEKCAYCQKLPYQVMEHFIPIELGGGTTQSNCVPACHSCNRKKNKSHPDSIHGLFSPQAIGVLITYIHQF